MIQKKRGLSRGLDALLAVKQRTDNPIENNHDSNSITSLKVTQLVSGKFQPRASIAPSELMELSESIKKQGVLQPIIVRKLSTDKYEIIAGERRWRAATQAQLQEVPVIIKNVSDQDALSIALIENIQRENLNPLEEAIALDRLAKEFILTHHEVAIAVGKSRTAITNLLRILQLPTEIKHMLENRQLDLGHAKVLLGVPLHLQNKIANKIITDNLSVRSTELLLSKYKQTASTDFNAIPQSHQNKLKLKADPDLIKLQKHLGDTFGAKVTIVTKNNKGKGKLIIEYNNLEELDGILERMKISEDY